MLVLVLVPATVLALALVTVLALALATALALVTVLVLVLAMVQVTVVPVRALATALADKVVVSSPQRLVKFDFILTHHSLRWFQAPVQRCCCHSHSSLSPDRRQWLRLRRLSSSHHPPDQGLERPSSCF